jgi:MFS transporter, NAG-T family, sugar:H+ symporter
MSASFCLIFMSFSSAQNFATSRSGNVGSNTLGILYSVFMVTNIVSSAIVSRLGPKLALIFGSMTYVLYVAANIIYTPWSMYPAGFLLGVGAAVLWTAQGVYITRCSGYHEVANDLPLKSSIGFFNGLFFSIFQVNQLLGNLLVALLFLQDVATNVIFIITSLIAASGTVLLTFIHKMPPPKVPSADDPTVLVDLDTTSNFDVTKTLNLLRDKRMALMVPIVIYSGMTQTFFFGTFPSLIDDKSWKFFTMAVFGAADAASSIFMGKLSDRIGRKKVLAHGFIIHLGVFIWLFLYEPAQHEHVLFFVLAILCGIGDGVFNTQLYAILGAYFPDDSEAAFANLKLFQSMVTAAAFFYNPYVALRVKLVLLVGLMFIGTSLVVYLDSKISSVEVGTSHHRNAAVEVAYVEHDYTDETDPHDVPQRRRNAV